MFNPMRHGVVAFQHGQGLNDHWRMIWRAVAQLRRGALQFL
jgi:hypothetical protein